MRWFVVFMMFLASMMNYMDRSALSVAAPLIMKDLGLNLAQRGMVFSSFFLGYALFNFIGGVLADKYGPRATFAAAMGLWSGFCALTAGAFNFLSLMVIRIFFGMGEGPCSSTANKMVYNWFPRREAASAVGVLSAGTPLGGAVSGPVVIFLAITFGWRLSFVCIGILGIVWMLAWLKFTTDKPEGHPKIGETEQTLSNNLSVEIKNPDKKKIAYYLRHPTVLATALAFFGYNYTLFFFLTWFPTYLTDVHHLSLKSMSLVNSIPWILGFIGLAAGGFISDSIFKMTGNALFSRKIVLSVCLAAAALCVALAGTMSNNLPGAVALMSTSIFFLYLTGSIYWAIIQDSVQGESIGSVGGFVHFLANTSGVIGPALTGFIVQTSGSYYAAFVLAGGVSILGSAGVALFVKDEPPICAEARG